jgi:hypothetical protein
VSKLLKRIGQIIPAYSSTLCYQFIDGGKRRRFLYPGGREGELLFLAM